MSKTKIEWADRNWTPIVGCDPVSPACANCYAAMMAARLEAMGHEKYAGIATRNGNMGKWTGKVTLWEPELLAPLKVRKPSTWFLTSMGDVGHEAVPDGFLDRLFAVMALCQQHTFYVLTKRPGRLREYLAFERRPYQVARRCVDMLIVDSIPKHCLGDTWPVKSLGDDPDCPDDITLQQWPLPNVWLGTTVENQATADERIPHLLASPAAVRFLSCEPLLGPVDLLRVAPPETEGTRLDALRGAYHCEGRNEPFEVSGIDWVIAGGESGPKARPMHPDWARGLRDQCAAAGVPFFFKQWGEWIDWRHAGAGEWSNATPQRDSYRGPCLGILRSCGHDMFSGRALPSTHTATGGISVRVGKKAAGRLLDGVEHNGVPE